MVIQVENLYTPPLRFPENTNDYIWQSGNFDAYAYNYYVYESKTNVDMLDYDKLGCPNGGYSQIYNFSTQQYGGDYPNFGKDTMARLKTYKVYTVSPNYLKGSYANSIYQSNRTVWRKC